MTFISSDNSILISELTSCKFDFTTAALQDVKTLNSSTVTLTGDGKTATKLTAAVKISTALGNLLTVDGTGLIVSSSSLPPSIPTVKVSVTDATAGYLFDKLVEGTNITLSKITTIDGEKVVINASSGVLDLTYADTSTIDFGGTGAVGSPLTAAVKISTTAGNALISNSTGLYVNIPSLSGESILVTTDSSTIGFTASGTAGHSLTGAVKISSQVGNTLVVSGNGLYVPTPTITQDTLVATDSNSINFTNSGAYGHDLTASLIISPDSGNGLSIRANGVFASQSSAETGITITASDSIEIATSGISQHTLTPTLKVSAVSGNQVVINADGLYIPASSSASGTLNYIAKFNSTTSVGDSLIYDNGSNVVIGGTSGSSLLNVIGQSSLSMTNTYSSGTHTVLGSSSNTTFSGVLPTSNVSFATHTTVFYPTFNGNTTIGGDTPFGTILATATIAFSAAGTVTMNNGTGGGLRAISSVNIGSYDNGTVNGTVTKTAGLEINGIFKVTGATATISRTDHYQILINDIGEFGNAGDVTNRYAIYQVGVNDINRFFGSVQNAGGTTQFTSDARIKENVVPFIRGLAEIDLIDTHKFNYVYNKSNQVTGIIAQELEAIIPEAVSKGSFELPDGSQKFSDFRMVDQNVLFYTMLNAIKELSAKVKALEAK